LTGKKGARAPACPALKTLLLKTGDDRPRWGDNPEEGIAAARAPNSRSAVAPTAPVCGRLPDHVSR